MDWHLVLATSLAGAAVAAFAQLAWAHASIPSLGDVPGMPGPAMPSVSVIVAARNEERHVGAAVRSMLTQQYADFELIAVDDRSTDGTSRVLAEAADADPRLTAVRVDSLPDGWLGKNHALHRGAEMARGELLLFADADVILAPDAITRAVRLMQVEEADHLAVTPRVIAAAWPVALVVNYFMMWFLLYLKPWRARDPRSRAFIGIGAFNMLRASTYFAVDGHARIALRPDDDIMLGKLVKRAGYRQLMAIGDDVASVEWYTSLREMARGFRKNAFAGLHYSIPLVIGATLGTLLLAVWPFVALWTAGGTARLLYGIAAGAQVAAYAGPLLTQRRGAPRTRPWLALLYPLAAMVFLGILLAAVGRTLRRGGIEWRETFYPLSRLRENRL